MTSTPAMTDELGFKDWPEPERARGRLAGDPRHDDLRRSRLETRARPTSAIRVRVVAILKDELGVTDPELLISACCTTRWRSRRLLSGLIASHLGPALTQRLRSMTPTIGWSSAGSNRGTRSAHTRSGARSGGTVSSRTNVFIRDLRPYRLACRPRHSPDRRARFLDSLTRTYLPLAEESREVSAPLRAAYEVLHAEYRQQAEAGT